MCVCTSYGINKFLFFRNYFFVPTDNAHESVATADKCENPSSRYIIDTALSFWGWLWGSFLFSGSLDRLVIMINETLRSQVNPR